jgi:hypothetical protein
MYTPQIAKKLFEQVRCVALAACDAPGTVDYPQVHRTPCVQRTSLAATFQTASKESL